MSASRVAESFAQTERELLAERVAALARISGALESLVSRLWIAHEQLAASTGDARVSQLASYRALREDVLRYRWYLDVQRESLGLSPDRSLDALYPIPDPLAE